MPTIHRLSALLLLCLAFAASSAQAQGSQCVQRPLTIPSTVNGEITISSCINISDYYDTYQLTGLQKGRKLRFTMTKGTLLNMLVRLERSGSTVIQASDYSKSTITMDVEIPASQTYNLIVKTITAGGLGRYTIAVADLDDPNATAQIVPIVGHVTGSGGSAFRSDLKLYNTAATPITGRLVLTPRNQSVGAGDLEMPFNVPAGGVLFYEDVYAVAAPGVNGAARLAVVPDNAATGLVVDTSTYTAQSDGGELGQSPTVFRASDFTAAPATLVSVTGKATERSNLFIMTGAAETTIIWTLRDANGVQLATVTRTYAPNATFQTSVSDVTGKATPPNGVLRAQINSGQARIAMNPVNNVSNQGRWLDFKPAP
jgi:hypothetical protein